MFADPARLPPCFNVLLSELSIEIWTVSAKGHSLSERKRELHLEGARSKQCSAARERAHLACELPRRMNRDEGLIYARGTQNLQLA